MQIARPGLALVSAAAFFTALAGWPRTTVAFDGTPQTATSVDKTPLQIFKDPEAALRAGLEDFRSGNSRSGIEALKYAAAGGESLARWKLAKMYADGDGVPQDDEKAYDYFEQIVENYDEDNSGPRERAVVSSAFVAVGAYSLNGIANTHVVPDPMRALEMFQYAATNFGNPDAQYDLARMYLDGVGVTKDAAQAARWLHLAAEKNHIEAQALLGQLLFTGREGVARQRGLGLMWLTLADQSAGQDKKNQWIVDLYQKATAAANDTDKQIAALYIADYKKRQRD
jgi:exopolysaccharide production negative regulator